MTPLGQGASHCRRCFADGSHLLLRISPHVCAVILFSPALPTCAPPRHPHSAWFWCYLPGEMANGAEELPSLPRAQPGPHGQRGAGNWGWDVALKFLLIPLEGILWIRLKTRHKPGKGAKPRRAAASAWWRWGTGHRGWEPARSSAGGDTGGFRCCSDTPGCPGWPWPGVLAPCPWLRRVRAERPGRGEAAPGAFPEADPAAFPEEAQLSQRV